VVEEVAVVVGLPLVEEEVEVAVVGLPLEVEEEVVVELPLVVEVEGSRPSGPA
jgi:hypothetical protein